MLVIIKAFLLYGYEKKRWMNWLILMLENLNVLNESRSSIHLHIPHDLTFMVDLARFDEYTSHAYASCSLCIVCFICGVFGWFYIVVVVI